MFNRRVLSFKKRWLEMDNERVKFATDSSMISIIIPLASLNNLKVLGININDVSTCKIVLKGSKEDFVTFVSKLLEKTGKYMEDISF